MSDKLADALKKTITTYSGFLTNSLGTLVVAGAEGLLAENAFNCPCETAAGDVVKLLTMMMMGGDDKLAPSPERMYYGISFIVWPAIILFFASIAVSTNILRCLVDHNCRSPGGQCYTCSPRREVRALQYMLSNAPYVFLPAIAWVAITLLDGRYYVCAVSRLPDACVDEMEAMKLMNETAYDMLKIENNQNRAFSQVLALTVLGTGVAIAGLCASCCLICSTIPYYQREYMKAYNKAELEAFHAVTSFAGNEEGKKGEKEGDTETTETATETDAETDAATPAAGGGATPSDKGVMNSLIEELKNKWKIFFKKADFSDWQNISELPTSDFPKKVGKKMHYSAFSEWMPPAEDKASDIAAREPPSHLVVPSLIVPAPLDNPTV